ncbi:MAG: glycosyltransferase [Blautia sp.]|nr:glycosyltransferase [Blautia sp.]
MKKLSVVVPAYNEELMVRRTAAVLREILGEAGIEYEIVFVNDGSSDRTWEKILEAAEEDKNVAGLCFSRNFGKEAAIFAGLSRAGGDCVAVMDCDLQHPPLTLVSMYRHWEQGYEVIEGIKSSRQEETKFHEKCSLLFYKLMSRATGTNMASTSDFKLLDREAVRAILAMPERNMFFRATSSWVGFKTTTIAFEVQEREAGESKWSTWSLIKYAFTNIVAFSTAPLQIVTVAGVGCFTCSLILLIYSLVQYFTGHAVEGFTTLLIVMLLIGSAIMISLGIIGYYIAKIYDEVRMRPRFIISETVREGKVDHHCNI